MAKCKWCDRSGWFLRLNSVGLCNNCSPLVKFDVQQRLKILNDSINIVNESKNLDTRLSRLDLLLEHANALYRYEQRGIPVVEPSPSAVLENFRGRKDQIILETLRTITEEAKKKSATVTAASSKVSSLTKALLKIREYTDKVDSKKSLTVLEKSVTNMIQKIQLQGYLNQAEKAEFKGQNKKALDQYYEALYFLKHDDIDDSLQQGMISHIEDKIIELGGTIR